MIDQKYGETSAVLCDASDSRLLMYIPQNGMMRLQRLRVATRICGETESDRSSLRVQRETNLWRN